MIAILMLIAIIIGYIRKGRLRNLSNIHIRMVPLLILAFLLQGAIYLGYSYDVAVIQDFDILIHFVSYIFLFAGLMSNFDNKWFVVMTMGMILNFLVIFLNGGRMPVSVHAAEVIGLGEGLEALFARRAGTHQPLEEGMLLWFLADVIPIRFPSFASILNNIYSAGDFFIYGGAMGLIQYAMRSEQTSEMEENLDALLEEEILPGEMTESLFEEEVDEEEIERLKELRKKREEETRRIFQSEATQYFNEQEQENPEASLPEEEEEILPVEESVEEQQEELENEIEVAEEQIEAEDIEEIEEIEELEAVLEEATPIEIAEPAAPEEEPDWKIYTQDFSNSELIGTSQLEEQIVKGENYTEEDLRQQRKYYTKPLHERMRIDLESDGYDWKKIEEEQPPPKPDVEDVEQEPQQEQIEKKAPQQPVDTTHPFIIVDGRIVENPSYRKPSSKQSPEMPKWKPAEEATEEPAPLEVETEIQEEPELSVNGWTQVQEKEEPSGNILQKLDDEERIELMKKMKERKEKGYSLVQVKIADKTITFWKKDL